MDAAAFSPAPEEGALQEIWEAGRREEEEEEASRNRGGSARGAENRRRGAKRNGKNPKSLAFFTARAGKFR